MKNENNTLDVISRNISHLGNIWTLLFLGILIVLGAICINLADISNRLSALEPQQFVVVKEVPMETYEVDNTPEPADISTLYQNEIVHLAKTIYGEARGCSKTQQAAVAWCILNRVDSDKYPDNIIDVITQKYQFSGYDKNHPVEDEIVDVATDVLSRWHRERNGETDVGRILPKEYLYFHGDGQINHFTMVSGGTNEWDWSWGSAY